MTTKERVFELIKSEDGKAISGENIAKSLSISRAAVWKAINALRKDGYSISAENNSGDISYKKE